MLTAVRSRTESNDDTHDTGASVARLGDMHCTLLRLPGDRVRSSSRAQDLAGRADVQENLETAEHQRAVTVRTCSAMLD